MLIVCVCGLRCWVARVCRGAVRNAIVSGWGWKDTWRHPSARALKHTLASSTHPLCRCLVSFRYLVENMEWLSDNLDGCLDEDYFLIDCPGQIELYSHIPVMRQVRTHTPTCVRTFMRTGHALCALALDAV
ncbi:hypothetical protein EON66_02895 [archaeon]|nr:MAG: hypothetical protein EON66_02895 [archaeon]